MRTLARTGLSPKSTSTIDLLDQIVDIMEHQQMLARKSFFFFFFFFET